MQEAAYQCFSLPLPFSQVSKNIFLKTMIKIPLFSMYKHLLHAYYVLGNTEVIFRLWQME